MAGFIPKAQARDLSEMGVVGDKEGACFPALGRDPDREYFDWHKGLWTERPEERRLSPGFFTRLKVHTAYHL